MPDHDFNEPQHGLPSGETFISTADPPNPPKAFDQVLVPLDGSAFSRTAMPTARALAHRFGAKLQTVDVVPHGGAAHVADLARGRGSALVCLSDRPRGRIAGAVLNSLSDAVLRQMALPIVVVGPMAERPGWDPEPRGWPTPLSAKEIVACVDGTPGSEQVLGEAAAWATALGKSLTILTVIKDEPEPVRQRSGVAQHRTPVGAAEYVDGLVDRWATADLEIDGVVLRDPISPASAVRTHLARRPAALLALVAPDRSGLRRVRRGATAAKMIRASSAPCLVVPGVEEGGA
jgi:nucleotide-binding universal stress UspA family protein